MMLQPASPDETRRAAVARLTLKERECLERWLTHATAKEIALEIGVSHHAVEKRLKSARQKLGVSTTLEAARLLASAEWYDRTASQPPEVAQEPPAPHSGLPDPPRPEPTTRRRRIIAGGSIMFASLVTALALSAQPPRPEADPAASQRQRSVLVVNRETGQTVDSDTAFVTVFSNLDSNKDGFLAGEELDRGRFRFIRASDQEDGSTALPSSNVTQFDTDGDKRVSEAEFRSGIAKLIRRP